VTRAFVAIRPPEPVLDAVDTRTRALDLGSARRAPREQWHITVQFLGDDADVDAVAAVLAGLRTPQGVVRLSPPGPLGNPKRSTVFAMFLVAGGVWLRMLADEVAERVRPLGHEPEDRPFVPHLTIARYRRATNMKAPVAAAGPEPVGEPWTVTEALLYESRRGRGPAEHVVRGRFPLHP